MPDDEIAKYKFAKEWPFKTDGGYTKGDILFYKLNDEGDEMIDFVHIEVKLSQGTEFSTRQKEFYRAIAKKKSILNFDLQYRPIDWPTGVPDGISITNDKCYRFFGDGTPNEIAITIEQTDVLKYETWPNN